ncbi:tRNA (adenosine(37)-N6)-threonylcarbamoyltransferase complex dimerization subunit type 1 TsaB [Limnohabitans sp.]|uniref:tRNA (adenosine(37)-N6)-threonylcarbamoyltransferase complex dimerization subunit type 1 TsaB n=1 Tax=Limnohabitans sp. TaxID=1907725 RepID=UPI00286EFC47|nr:tRNA (adenosine(37)-N6)-threonylcarbamoyltransferase complex dimerization subunit type 1 TsaB [Limnohabitans sp.]
MHTNQWLALETSTDTLSLAVARGTQTWTHTSAGGALTSTHMIPQTLALLKEAGLALTDLQAVVFGRGPGAFTGLRTACSVAQGLAFGADLSVLPIDTLLAVAEEARAARVANGSAKGAMSVMRVLAVMDARMEQVYAAAYEFKPNVGGASISVDETNQMPGVWRCVQEPELHSPEALHWPADWTQESFIAAGNAWPVYPGRWPAALTAPQVMALPTAVALLRLAPVAWEAGEAVPPEEALPLYIRDKVAQTTDERMQIKAQQAELIAQAATPTITP